MRFGLVGVGLAAATLACTGDARVSDGGTCYGSAGPPPSCRDRGCPQTFTMEAQAVCPSGPGVRQGVTFLTGCAGGLEVIVYLGVDTADDIFFRADGSLLGYRHSSANFGGSYTCVPGVPDGFDFGACAAHSGIVCGVPDAGP